MFLKTSLYFKVYISVNKWLIVYKIIRVRNPRKHLTVWKTKKKRFCKQNVFTNHIFNIYVLRGFGWYAIKPNQINHSISLLVIRILYSLFFALYSLLCHRKVEWVGLNFSIYTYTFFFVCFFVFLNLIQVFRYMRCDPKE